MYKPGSKGFCKVVKHGPLCSPRFCKAEEECFSKEKVLRSISYDMAAKKRKKDLMNNNSKVPCESKTGSKRHCFHKSEGRTRAKTIYQTWTPSQESMRMLCNIDEGRSSLITLFLINFPSLQCFDNRFTSVECAFLTKARGCQNQSGC